MLTSTNNAARVENLFLNMALEEKSLPTPDVDCRPYGMINL